MRGKHSSTRGRPSPTRGRSPPLRGKLPPTRGRPPPTRGKTSPTRGKLAPSGGKTAPSWGKTLRSRGETRPRCYPPSKPKRPLTTRKEPRHEKRVHAASPSRRKDPALRLRLSRNARTRRPCRRGRSGGVTASSRRRGRRAQRIRHRDAGDPLRRADDVHPPQHR